MSSRGSGSGPPHPGSPGERELVDLLVRHAPRSPRQLNAPYEADAELIRVGGPKPPPDGWLAVTTDSISEEIDSGLYEGAEEIGWMAVTASASDLAAVGADPLGVMLDVSVPGDCSERFVRRLGRGVADAATSYGLPLLGGDTNRSSTLRIGSTALGWVVGRPSTRRGARPGHLIYTTGPAGLGAAVALERLLEEGRIRDALPFRPRARLTEGARFRAVIAACVDTSDGLLRALDDLLRLEGLGAELDPPVETLLHRDALTGATRRGLPGWLFLAGPHGDYELVFTVPPEDRGRLERVAGTTATPLLRIGRVVATPGVALAAEDHAFRLDPSETSRLFDRVGGDPALYLERLVRMDEELRRRGGGWPTWASRSAPSAPSPPSPAHPSGSALPGLDPRLAASSADTPRERMPEQTAALPATHGDSDVETARSQADPARRRRRRHGGL